jgi:hypothetical protein
MTKNYTEFMLRNYKKLTSVLEIAILTSAKTGIVLERSRVIIVLLKCLIVRRASDPRAATEGARVLDDNKRI